MTRISLVSSVAPFLAVLALAACGGSTPEQRADPVKGFASRDECGQVADHFFTIQLHGTSENVPQEHLLNGSNLEYRQRFETFVAACSTKWSHRDAACALAAPAFQYVKQCEVTEGTTPLIGTRAEGWNHGGL